MLVTDIVNMYVTVIIVLIFVALFIYKSMKRPHNYPPGPPRYPIIGNLLELDSKRPTKTFRKWSNKYGKIYSINFGATDIVVVTDAQALKKAFTGNDFLDRPNNLTFRPFQKYQNVGISTSWGDIWQEHRRFTLKHLRDFGFGKSTTEEKILTEMREVISKLREKDGKEVELSWDLNVAVTNVIWGITAGVRMDQDSPENLKFISFIQDFFKDFSPVHIIDAFPWLKKILPRKWLSLDEVYEHADHYLNFFREEVEKHKLSFDENEEDQDLIDSYLRKFKQEEKKPRFDREFEEFNLYAIIGDLFSAGGESTATTTRWAFVFLLKYPHVQKRIQEGLDEVIGRDRMPSLSDRSRMPYMEAFIMETQRVANVIPIGIPHAATCDTTLLGYNIPKGTHIMPDITHCFSDPEVWDSPDEFRPQRFLNENNEIVKYDNFIPFSIGRRVCPGEALAKSELFLIISCLLQQFDFEPVSGNPKDVDLEPDFESLLRYPKPHNMKIKLRKK